MPQFELLGSLVRDLHQEFVRLYYLFLPVCFALALVFAWVRSPQGGPEFLEVLKRAIVSTLLLAAFPEISRVIVLVADGLAERIDSMNSLDNVIRMAQEKSKGYSGSVASVLIQYNDFIVATLSFLSFLLLYIARYLTIAMYHFFWTLFMVISPLLMLFNIFGSTADITRNLFKGMIEVASWKIMWAVLGAMLSALSFGNLYQTEGNYLVLIVMNFIIAIAMLMTPLLVRSITGSGLQRMSSTIGTAAVTAMAAAPARMAATEIVTRRMIQSGHRSISTRIQNYRTRKNSSK